LRGSQITASGTSAAIAYLLLILTVVVCASFFNYVVLGQLRKARA
jgi:multiple sugar transport system permease protein